MPINTETLTPQQKELAELFKPVALADTPQKKQLEFMKFLGALKSKKVMAAKKLLDPSSVVRESELQGSLTDGL